MGLTTPLTLIALSTISLLASYADASITVYYQVQQSLAMQATQTSANASYTGLAAYNPTTLVPPPLPTQLSPTAFNIQLGTADTVTNLSIQHPSPFFGFSIEMSVSNQLLGRNGSVINVPFLNLLSNVVERAGEIHIRVGGNTQEAAELVDTIPGGALLAKDYSSVSGTTNTPPITFTDELLYLMNNISSLVNVKWFLGIPFNDTNFRMAIVEDGASILGDNLIGLQAGNEPDFYGGNGKRNKSYAPADYMNDFGLLVNVMQDPKFDTTRNLLLTPSISTVWTPQQVWDTGLVQKFTSNIKMLSVERYPNDNCGAVFGKGNAQNPQNVLPNYLNHGAVQGLVADYIPSTVFAQTMGKPFIMFETNTASCGGFPGVSNSFASALWALDYGLQMAWGNFTQALLHFGGQSVVYNPFTAPPTNQSSFHQWTVGPVYYSVLAMAEVIGSTGKAQVVDLFANNFNTFTPAYAIYEDQDPVRVALFNYNDDSTGANAYTASISVPNAVSSVQVKYLNASSVSQLNNITWAGQTFGGYFESDGRPMGDVDIRTVQCNNNVCPVQVPAPGFALVFLTSQALSESDGGATKTYSTTFLTKSYNTATVNPAVLETSNGHSGGIFNQMGSTSKGSIKNSAATHARIGMGMVMTSLFGVVVLVGKLR